VRASRNIIVLTLATLIISFGLQTWLEFIPAYLQALGAGAIILGLFGSLQDFFLAVYHYPAGWLNDRFSIKFALVLASVGGILGYVSYIFSPNLLLIFLGLPFVMLWPGFIKPSATRLLTSQLPLRDRLGGFALVTIIVQLSLLLAPIVGGVLIFIFGLQTGLRIGLGLTVAAALLIGLLQLVGYQSMPAQKGASPLTLFREMRDGFKRLLIGEVLVNYGEALIRCLVVVYAINSLNAPYWGVGLMLAAEALVTMFVTGPLSRVAAAIGPKPVLIGCYLLAAIFPISVFIAPTWIWLFICFIIAGLRDSGESVRQAMIGSMATAERRGQEIGLYETLLRLALVPAGIMGGAIWFLVGPWLAFLLAMFAGLMGCFVFAAIGPAVVMKGKDE
jgi:MFS family permease